MSIFTRLAAILSVVALPSAALAQVPEGPDPAAGSPSVLRDLTRSAIAIPLPSGAAEDRSRLETLVSDSARFPLLRASLDRAALPAPRSFGLVAPSLGLAANSAIPWSMNDASAWTGRGATITVSGGAYARLGPITAVLAPRVHLAQNRPFRFVAIESPERSPFQAEWRIGDTSIDLPTRFGSRPFRMVDPGESAVFVDAGPVRGGLTTASEWWGPGMRNAIVLSDNAPGIPRAFVRTPRPVRTGMGELAGVWTVGTMTESPFFDGTAANDYRSFSAAALTFTPAFEPQLSLGVARVVYASVDGRLAAAGRALDPFVRRNGGSGSDFEHIVTGFGRWAFPGAGLAVHGELARLRLPSGFRDLLVSPHHTQGFTLGAEWAGPAFGDRLVRIQAEGTMLEKSTTYRLRPTPGFYYGPRVPQGYTHRGQSVGAAIGPGASSQWLAADLIADVGSFGLFVNRVRWDQDAYYTRPNADRYFAYDVSLVFGARGDAALGRYRLAGEIARELRYNFMFQNPSYTFGGDMATDVVNWQLRLSLEPDFHR